MTKSLSFVRAQMLPQQAPPVTERGAVKWLRENLFSNWFNSLLTVLGALAVFWLLQATLPWLLNGVWTAKSLGECRSIVAASAGEGASGACWAMIRERWNQFLFGFYPVEAYWRPVLAFGLLFVALAPVLYFGLRRTNMLMIGVTGALTVLALLGMHTDGAHALLVAVILRRCWASPPWPRPNCSGLP